MDKAAIIERAKDYIAREKDAHFRQEVQALIAAEDTAELADRFYRNLEFGTGGLRGVIGPAGENLVNYSIVLTSWSGLPPKVIPKR